MIDLKNCKKIFDSNVVFENISYQFQNNVYWIKGTNGVGKSVLCRCMVGVEKFTLGESVCDGKNILYLPEVALGESWLTIDENIDLLLYYFKVKISNEEKQKIREKLNMDCGEKLIDVASVGNNMKVGLFLVFLKNFWDVIILDEALSHIDIESQNIIFKELEERCQEGATVILVHHGEIGYQFQQQKFMALKLEQSGIYVEE